MSSSSPRDVTRILADVNAGDKEAADLLYGRVYDELRHLASGLIRQRGREYTLQATALVNEAYLRMVDQKAPWESRGHFFSVAAMAMRRILVDHARRRSAAKRGGGQAALALDEAVAMFEERSVNLLALDEALTRLAALDPEKSRMVELRFFAGLTIPEVADILNTSHATVERDWAFVKAWLLREVKKGDTLSEESPAE